MTAPRRRSDSASDGPTPGMSARAKRAMKSRSPPGGTTNTPNGLFTPAAILASVRPVAAPIDSEMAVRSSTSAWMRRQVCSSGSPW